MPKTYAGSKPFQYHINRRTDQKRIPTGKAQRLGGDEGLTGMVQGMEASDIEERFARALDNNPNVDGYTFRSTFIAGRMMPGSVELDFLVYSLGEAVPVQVDGEYAHKSAEQRETDMLKDAQLDATLAGAARPTERIPGDLLSNQENANRLVLERF